jgi:hypothetical protein
MTDVQRLAEALVADADAIAERAAQRMQEQLPSYARVDVDDLVPVVRANTHNILDAIRDPDADRSGDEEHYRESGEQRARQGITSDEMLHAWRIGLEVTRAAAHETAERIGVDDATLLAFVEATLTRGDAGMVESASAHRATELEMARSEQHHRANLVRGVLFGTLAPAATRVQASAYGLDPAATYCALRTRPDDGARVRALEWELGVGDGAGPRRGLAALLDGDLAGFVLAPLPGTVTATVGVGPPAPLHALENSFRLATRALETALALGAAGPAEVAGLGLAPAVIADNDVGVEVARRIVEPVLAQGRTGVALIETVTRYLDNDMRLEATAADLFLHVNTVRYRLRRFEELTGMSLRRVDDLVQVWWAIERTRLAPADAEPL